MDEKFVAKLFLEDINPLLRMCGLDYVRGPFMDMVHMLVEKERYMLIYGQLNYVHFNKDNHKKQYKRKDNNQVNMAEPSANEEEK